MQKSEVPEKASVYLPDSRPWTWRANPLAASVGHFSTQTWGVGHPRVRMAGFKQRVRSKYIR